MSELIIPDGATEFQLDSKRGIIHFGKNWEYAGSCIYRWGSAWDALEVPQLWDVKDSMPVGVLTTALWVEDIHSFHLIKKAVEHINLISVCVTLGRFLAKG